MMRSNQSQNRAKLLKEINEVSFAVYDILLYLDTHPCDKEAMEFYQKNVSKRRELMKEYSRAFGPLTVDDAELSCGDTWKWMEQPFPWEQEGGCR